jgi:hypothetical protein
MDGTYRIGVNYYRGTTTQVASVVVTSGPTTRTYSQTFTTALGSAGNDNFTTICSVLVVTANGTRTITITP